MQKETLSRLEEIDKDVFIKTANLQEDLKFGVSEFAQLTEFNNYEYEDSYAEFLSRKLCKPDEGDLNNLYIGIAQNKDFVYISCCISHFICSFKFEHNESEEPVVDVLTYMINRSEDVEKKPFLEASDKNILASNVSMNQFFSDAEKEGYVFFMDSEEADLGEGGVKMMEIANSVVGVNPMTIFSGHSMDNIDKIKLIAFRKHMGFNTINVPNTSFDKFLSKVITQGKKKIVFLVKKTETVKVKKLFSKYIRKYPNSISFLVFPESGKKAKNVLDLKLIHPKSLILSEI